MRHFTAAQRAAFKGVYESPVVTKLTATPLAQITECLLGASNAMAVARAGALPRDPMDQRLMAAVNGGQITLQPRPINPAGDGSALPFATAPAVPIHSGGQLSMSLLGVPGYTNLEVYLHVLSEQRIRERR